MVVLDRIKPIHDFYFSLKLITMRGKYTKIWAQKQSQSFFKTKEGVQFCKIDNVCSAKLSDQSSPKTQFMLVKL